MEKVKDPIGTLLSNCNHTIKDFIKFSIFRVIVN